MKGLGIKTLLFYYLAQELEPIPLQAPPTPRFFLFSYPSMSLGSVAAPQLALAFIGYTLLALLPS